MTHIFTVHVKLGISLLMDIFSSENNKKSSQTCIHNNLIIFSDNFFTEKYIDTKIENMQYSICLLFFFSLCLVVLVVCGFFNTIIIKIGILVILSTQEMSKSNCHSTMLIFNKYHDTFLTEISCFSAVNLSNDFPKNAYE